MRKDTGATITIESKGNSIHTFDDWGLVITNAVPVGDPKQETNFITVSGRNAPIDVSDALIGRPSYLYRPIEIHLAGIKNRMGWDDILSTLRNAIDGRIIQISFDNDLDNYYRGRCHIEKFERVYDKGEFILSIPQADPYKYEKIKASEPWIWDIFSFVDGVIRSFGEVKVNGTATMNIPSGHMYVVPEFQVSTTSEIKLNNGTREYTMKAGRNRFPSLLVNGDEEVTLTFVGNGTVTIDYRGGSL